MPCGQVVTPTSVRAYYVLDAPACNTIVKFHGKQKDLKDIFPEECPAKTADQKVLDRTNPCGLGSPATEDKAKVAECMKQLLGELDKADPAEK